MINIQKYRKYEEVSTKWNELWNRENEMSVYQSPKYMEIMCNHLLPYRMILTAIPEFYVFTENGKTILIVPMYYSIIKRRYYLLGHKMGCGYLNVIHSCELSEKKMEECFELLKQKYGIKIISFSRVKENTLLGSMLKKKGCKLNKIPCTEIQLPKTYDEYFQSLSKKTRQNIRTAYNRLARDKHIIEFECKKYSELKRTEYDNILDIYIERQISKYKKYGKRLYGFLVRRFDVGTMVEHSDFLNRIYIIKIDNEIVAFFDGLSYNSTETIVPRLAISEKYGNYSPGILLINESIKWAYENDAFNSLDLTHGNEFYKKSMGGKEHYCIDDVWKIK